MDGCAVECVAANRPCRNAFRVCTCVCVCFLYHFGGFRCLDRLSGNAVLRRLSSNNNNNSNHNDSPHKLVSYWRLRRTRWTLKFAYTAGRLSVSVLRVAPTDGGLDTSGHVWTRLDSSGLAQTQKAKIKK